MPSVAIIGGTGVYHPDLLTEVAEVPVETPFGDVRVTLGKYQGKEVAFLPRHGAAHSVPPHLVNYRANLTALKKIGVRSIMATAAVGSLNAEMKPGEFVFVNQFLDFTKGRKHTFFEGGPEGVVHIDLTEPYCPELRGTLARAARALGLPAKEGGVYVCTEGPRFETPAEIKMFRHLGGDLVGMTGIPEVVLAREAEVCYATVAMVTNFAAGIAACRLSHQEVVEMMRAQGENIRRLLMQAVAWIDGDRECACQRALSGPMEA
ncbi:MAG: S-methyl-5'-thioadenosine phosphorylase [Ammonifex sp.]|jgi:5'-methylthioadenosine phosphorylase|nr:MAG: S-methyl-5'-thioadenosine phosphorylase [Ammonifex sp.]